LLDEDQEMTFVGLPILALFGHGAMSDLSPLCALKRTSADALRLGRFACGNGIGMPTGGAAPLHALEQQCRRLDPLPIIGPIVALALSIMAAVHVEDLRDTAAGTGALVWALATGFRQMCFAKSPKKRNQNKDVLEILALPSGIEPLSPP
jgi:hypothetical protein